MSRCAAALSQQPPLHSRGPPAKSLVHATCALVRQSHTHLSCNLAGCSCPAVPFWSARFLLFQLSAFVCYITIAAAKFVQLALCRLHDSSVQQTIESIACVSCANSDCPDLAQQVHFRTPSAMTMGQAQLADSQTQTLATSLVLQLLGMTAPAV